MTVGGGGRGIEVSEGFPQNNSVKKKLKMVSLGSFGHFAITVLHTVFYICVFAF